MPQPGPKNYLPLAAVGLLLFLIGAINATPIDAELRRWFFVVGAVLLYVAHDLFCRAQIYAEIASYEGTVHRIAWRPFQGAFFTRGWRNKRRYRFFHVWYEDRDGQQRAELCGMSLLFGSSWDVE